MLIIENRKKMIIVILAQEVVFDESLSGNENEIRESKEEQERDNAMLTKSRHNPEAHRGRSLGHCFTQTNVPRGLLNDGQNVSNLFLPCSWVI